MTTVIELERVTKRYGGGGGGAAAVDGLSLSVREGEVCVLVGPSGCGKSTTMRMINRLIEPDAGTIRVGGVDIATIDPVQLRRGIGYVIQDVGLFPHQSVAQNIATVPSLLGWDRRRAAERVDELLALVDLEPSAYRDRYPRELSGGRAQRVGVARALAADPPVFLMDEPFGALDPIIRDRLQDEFRRLQAELRKTVVFVTHDLDEAVKMGDRIAVMAVGGRLEQYASPAEVLANPATPFVSSFVGSDRGLKLLSVSVLDESNARPWPTIVDGGLAPLDRVSPAVLDRGGSFMGWLDPSGRVRGENDRVHVGATRRDALALLLLDGRERIALVDDAGRFLGVLTASDVLAHSDGWSKSSA